jgi:hypothetical protein
MAVLLELHSTGTTGILKLRTVETRVLYAEKNFR